MDTPRGDGFVIDHGPEVRYRMGHQDDSRWDGFVFYPGDILISTRSRNGTMWVQMICALLILQTPDLPAPLAELSPWMEWLSLDRDELLAGLASQKHRRFIKTHTPLDGLALDSRVTYIVVARHPLDMAVSLYHHYANLDVRRLNELAGQPEAGESEPLPPLREWLLSWITQDSDPYQQADSLPGVMHHVADAWSRRSEPNTILVHYDDLAADLEGQMRQLAGRLSIAVPASLWPDLVNAATFPSMRSRAEHFTPGRVVETLVSTFWIGLAQHLSACQVPACLREELVCMFAIGRHSLQFSVGDQLVDLRTALIPPHSDSSSLTRGRC